MRSERRPARYSRRALGRFGAAVVFGAPASCVPDGRLKRELSLTPIARDDGIAIGRPEDVGLDFAAVEAAYARVFDERQLPNIRSLLVMRHGVLVAEGYVADPADIDRPAALMSATKSFTSTLAGIALDRGELTSLDACVGELLSDKTSDPDKREIALRDTLTMRAGIEYSNNDFSAEMEYGGITDSVAFILDHPLSATPGTVFNYTDACAHLAGALVQRAVGTTLEEYAKRHLFPSLGIVNHAWLSQADGLSYGAYGLYLKPRDFLRFGRAMLASRRGEQNLVVSTEWLEQATSFQVHPDGGQGFEYGYLWWLAPDKLGFTASGHGGQFAFSVPDLDVEVVVTADPGSNEEKVSVSLTDVRELVTTIVSGAR